MRIAEIIRLLSQPATSPEVEGALTALSVYRRPEVQWDENDADGPVVNAQDWVVNSDAGIEFGFEDEASWRGQDRFEWGRAPMLLTQIYFYGDHKGVAPYRGELPFGLQLDDSPDVVRQRLARFEQTRRSYVRDTWELEDFTLIVSYAGDRDHIDFVLCMLRAPASLAAMAGTDRGIDAALLISVLGKPLFDPVLRNALEPLGFEQLIESVRQTHAADLRATCGIELNFGKPVVPRERTVAPLNTLVLSFALLYRDRELEARGWQGTLPLGIGFDDSPDTVLAKAGREPDQRADEEFAGYALWHFPDFSLHVYYSTMHNYVLRVRVLAPGVWESYRSG